MSLFICFALAWILAGAQYVVFRSVITFGTFIGTTVLFVIGGASFIWEVAG